MKLYGREMTKADILRRVGDISQLGGVRSYTLNSGKGKGVEAYEINTGAGLRFTLLKDRCLDIGWADFNGTPLSFISKAGVSGSLYFEHRGEELHRVFAPGLITTCGLRNVGAFCRVRGEEFGQHGRISNAPAEEAYAFGRWEENEYRIRAGGTMREGVLYGENLYLIRSYETALGRTSFRLTDTIINRSFREEQIAIVYHTNFGYPLLDKDARLSLPEGRIVNHDGQFWPDGTEQIPDAEDTAARQPGYRILFDEERIHVSITNRRLTGFKGVYMEYDRNALPCFALWRSFSSGDYVVGFEPGTSFPMGRENSLREGYMITLKPQEEYRIELELGIEF